MKESSQIRHERKTAVGGDRDLSHLVSVPASSGGIPAQLADVVAQTRSKVSWAISASCLAAERVGMPWFHATKLISSGPVSVGCSQIVCHQKCPSQIIDPIDSKPGSESGRT